MNQKHNVTAENSAFKYQLYSSGLASGAVTISLGETNVFVSATAAANSATGQDFFLSLLITKKNLLQQVNFPAVILKEKVDLVKKRF